MTSIWSSRQRHDAVALLRVHVGLGGSGHIGEEDDGVHHHQDDRQRLEPQRVHDRPQVLPVLRDQRVLRLIANVLHGYAPGIEAGPVLGVGAPLLAAHPAPLQALQLVRARKGDGHPW